MKENHERKVFVQIIGKFFLSETGFRRLHFQYFSFLSVWIFSKTARFQTFKKDRKKPNRFFYNRLVGFMSSAPMTAIVLAKENGVKEWRELMGPTKTYRAKEIAPTSIRALYGISDTRNAAHGSDSDESARKEISYFFPEFCFDHWFENHEPFYREKRDQLVWCEERGIHHYAGT
ncbi:nucleoside diphosphate kinase 6-like isoform X2 [Acropora millepora]|uniref:nucleoside diphosphate kinase 6-like isoform X2 n=1 Tax=Acropora millepora TaxID=45264 RepID=UPI001CF4F1C3|nr:nucleoside diphosphate kinase 6-like isoform X2 [Acropora millepora]